MKVEIPDDALPAGYVPVRYGAPKALDSYITPQGEIKTAYYDIHGMYLIVAYYDLEGVLQPGPAILDRDDKTAIIKEKYGKVKL